MQRKMIVKSLIQHTHKRNRRIFKTRIIEYLLSDKNKVLPEKLDISVFWWYY